MASPLPVPDPVRAPTTRRLDVAALAVLGTAAATLLALGSGIDAWRHDSLYYIGDFGPKAFRNGRWLAALVWRPSILLPPVVTWWLGYLAFAAFAFRVARVNGLDERAALIFALLAMQIPCALGQSFWPAGTLPGPLLLVLAAALHGRIPAIAFYAGFGVLFFGVSQHYYFLLPLLDLPRIHRDASSPLLGIVSLLALWTAGFGVGAGFAYLLVFEVLSYEREPIPAWREPHPATDLTSLLENLGSRARLVAEHLAVVARLSLGAVPLAGLALAWAWPQRGDRIAARALCCASVGIAIHVATIPIGTKIDFRTLLPLFFAALAFAFFGPTSAWQRRALPIAAVLVAIPFAITNLENLRWYRGVTELYRESLVAASPRPPEQYPGVVLAGGTAHALQRQAEARLGHTARYIVPKLSEERGFDLRWRPAAIAAGFRQVRFCRPPGCPTLHPERCEAGPVCVHGTTPEGDLVVTLTGDPLPDAQ